MSDIIKILRCIISNNSHNMHNYDRVDDGINKHIFIPAPILLLGLFSYHVPKMCF
jgi:hypothetical protein